MFRRRPTGKAVLSQKEAVKGRRVVEGCTCASPDRAEQLADAQSWSGLDSGGAFALGSFRGSLGRGSQGTCRATCHLRRALAADVRPVGKGLAGHGSNARGAGRARAGAREGEGEGVDGSAEGRGPV